MRLGNEMKCKQKKVQRKYLPDDVRVMEHSVSSVAAEELEQ